MSPPRPAVALLLFLLLRHAAAMSGTNTSRQHRHNATIDTWTYYNQSRRIDNQKQPFFNSTSSLQKYELNFIDTDDTKTVENHPVQSSRYHIDPDDSNSFNVESDKQNNLSDIATIVSSKLIQKNNSADAKYNNHLNLQENDDPDDSNSLNIESNKQNNFSNFAKIVSNKPIQKSNSADAKSSDHLNLQENIDPDDSNSLNIESDKQNDLSDIATVVSSKLIQKSNSTDAKSSDHLSENIDPDDSNSLHIESDKPNNLSDIATVVSSKLIQKSNSAAKSNDYLNLQENIDPDDSNSLYVESDKQNNLSDIATVVSSKSIKKSNSAGRSSDHLNVQENIDLDDSNSLNIESDKQNNLSDIATVVSSKLIQKSYSATKSSNHLNLQENIDPDDSNSLNIESDKQNNLSDIATVVSSKFIQKNHSADAKSSDFNLQESIDPEDPINLNIALNKQNNLNDATIIRKKSNSNIKQLKIKKPNTENENCSSNINYTKENLQCLGKIETKPNIQKSKINKENISLISKPIKDYVLSYSTKRFTKRNKSIQKPIEDSTIVSKRTGTSSRFISNTNETSEKRSTVRGRKQNVASRFIEFLPKTAAMRLPDHGSGPLQRRAVVSLLGLFELSTRQGIRPEGKSELAAARLAVKHINEKKLLPGYTLELLTNDTQCDPGVGVDRFFHALYTQKNTRMVMLLGSACSEVTESLAKVVPYWNMVQVSFGSTSPALSDRSEFPLFYRTVAPDSSHNPARIAFVQRFGWDSVAALSQNEDAYSLALNDLVTELERANITCTATITFAETDLREQLRVLKDLDTRIIIGSFSHEVAPKIFCEAYQLGMFGADYAWIVHGNGASTWWMNTTECPRHQLAEAVEGLILVSSHNSIVGAEPSYSGLTNEEFARALLGEQVPVSKYAPQTYDAVWAIALALSHAEAAWSAANTTVGHFDYTRRDMATEFLQQLGQLNFLGISGPVSFSGADRVGTSAFHQVQGELVRTVALYYPGSSSLDFTCPGCEPLRWQGGQVPIARRVIKLRVVTIPPAAFLAVSSLAVVGISLALAFLAFNLHFRKLKSIKLSSPRLNNMTVVGCILVYVAVILLGLDHATLRVTDHFSTICTLRVYLLSAGFSLAFGSMFTKTYRVHRIFIRSRSGVVKDKLLQDTQLISLICVLLLIDVLIVTLWVVIDPMQRHLRNLSLEISAADRSVVYQPQVEVCRSQNTNGWLSALYAYKGLLLIVGVYMAWETRHVKIPALNDSQYIGMSVYSVVITSGIFVVLANLMSDRATLAFVTMTTFILISTTTTLCLLFLPTLHAILKRADNCDPVVQSMGLKIECNTRRFVTDDRRELQYRVEIQNKVYRREVAALDLEIGRLEKQLLEMNSVSCSSSTSSLKKVDLSPMEESMHHPRTPSIGGGLPLLLLSVLPPVIPRASWPSAVQELPMRRSVTFCSEPKLDDQHSARRQREPAIDLYNLCLRPDRFNEKVGVFGRLRNFFGSRPSIRKSSAASFAGNSNVGIAGALKAHMGYIAGLVPGTNKTHMASSCNTSTLAIHKLDGSVSTKDLYSRRQSFARAGGSGPIISVTSDTDMIDDDDANDFRRKFSLGLCLTKKDDTNDASKVNFSLPLQKRKSITHQHSQPVLSFRERARGSPRFPHRIVPTCSLNALEDRRKSSSSTTSQHLQLQQSAIRRSSQQPASLFIHTNAKKRASLSQQMASKWRSMEDASTTTLPGSRRGSGVLAISCLPSSAGFQPRAASYSPNCDVWSTAEFGIPFSELGKTSSPSHGLGKPQHDAPQ